MTFNDKLHRATDLIVFFFKQRISQISIEKEREREVKQNKNIRLKLNFIGKKGRNVMEGYNILILI